MMKKWLTLLVCIFSFVAARAQSYDPVTLMLAFQDKYAASERISGQVKWKKLNGESFVGHFVVEGEKFQLVWQDGEIRGDGTYEWEIMHRSKRIKKNFYDPLLAPSMVYAFRFIRLDLEAEPVKVGGTAEKIALEIEFGSSIAQGNHYLTIDPKTLMPVKITINVTPEGFYEQAEFGDIRSGEDANQGDYTVEFIDWKKKGYALTDMAKGDTDAIWPEERALKN